MTMKEALGALAPAAAVAALREALEEHTAEVRPKLLGLVDEAARQRESLHEREKERDDADRDAARRQREEIRGDVERATVAVREVVEALEGRIVELRTSLEPRLASLEAALARLESSDRLEELQRETFEVKRLVGDEARRGRRAEQAPRHLPAARSRRAPTPEQGLTPRRFSPAGWPGTAPRSGRDGRATRRDVPRPRLLPEELGARLVAEDHPSARLRDGRGDATGDPDRDGEVEAPRSAWNA
ncbi:MAG: hypothetical protein IPP07_23880 [Holophagales bacterium]|nr:hypothetical protein [Holophagales bacterium]